MARKAGQKPKPTALKKSQGNLGRRKLNEREPEYPALTHIEPPATLIDETAINAWGFYMPELLKSQVITILDIHNLEQFCNCMAYVMQMDTIIKDSASFITGKTGLKKHPAHTIRAENLRFLDKFGSLLGLDPSSRVGLIGKDNTTAKTNPFAKF
jgi:P27 family predicted phage terminase small subunit